MTSTAFALAGLGGFNAHGAGFLKAADALGVVPDLVTATSGQIVVLADWLRGEDLERVLVDPAMEHNPFAQVAVAVAGEPNVFRPAFEEMLLRWWTPAVPGEKAFAALFDRLLPAQIYVPTRTAAEFQAIARALDSGLTPDGRVIGVVFNAYDLEQGTAVLFGNARARELWPATKRIAPHQGGVSGDQLSGEEHALHPITAKAVESALWLSLYGFNALPQPHLIDGAYHRSCLVSELHEFDRIFVARPLAQGWRKRPPGNWFDVQDWQTEMWFSASYKAEVDALRQINGLVASGQLGPPFKLVDLVEVAPETPAGFFNFFIERDRIFHDAYRLAIDQFRSRGLAGDRQS